MRLVVDTSELVGELLRTGGRARLGDEKLDLFLAEHMWGEVSIELPRRIVAFSRARDLDPKVGEELISLCLEAIEANIVIVDRAAYTPLRDEALARSVRDPHDWPAVACALALSAGVWTSDNDFLGTGVPTWTTETVQLWLERNPE